MSNYISTTHIRDLAQAPYVPRSLSTRCPALKNISFPSRGIKVAGHLHIPNDTSTTKRSAIIIGHPMTGVKDRSPDAYASRLAEKGFHVLTFDAAYQGESEGSPHFLEDPYQRAWDNSAALDYLTTLKEIDPERIGIMGIRASGGYTSFAAQTDPRMKAVAMVSGADAGSVFRDVLPTGSTPRD